MKLNENSDYLPYVLGRMFYVLEWIQELANANLNATIKDKYFNAASASPVTVFPFLIRLAQKHLRKIDGRRREAREKDLAELMEKVNETFPARLTLPEQGAFQIGYYHQMQKRFAKKEEM